MLMRKTKTVDKKKSRKTSLIICVLIITVATVCCSYFIRTNSVSRYSYYYKTLQSGHIAEESIYVKSSIDVVDEEATRLRLQRLEQSVLPVFSFNPKAGLESIAAFEKIKEESGFNSDIIMISYKLISDILTEGYFSSDELNQMKKKGYDSILVYQAYSDVVNSEKNKRISHKLCSENIDTYIDRYLYDFESSLNEEDKTTIRLIIKSCLVPNILYDDILTRTEMTEALEKAMPVIVTMQKGQVIITKDKVITDEQLSVLKLLSESNSVSLEELLGETLFCLVSYSLIILLLSYFVNKDSLHFLQYLITMIVLMVVNLFITFMETYYSTLLLKFDFADAFMPIVFVPVFMTMISNKKAVGFCSALLVGVSLAAMPGAGLMTFFYVTICSCGSVYFVNFLTKRIESFYQWIISTAFCCFVTLLFVFINGCSFGYLPIELLGVVANTTLASILTLVVLPILEKILNIPTAFRLHELAFTDSPLLKRLAQTAPGTYTHSRVVSELAANAAAEVGANAMIARVGALYHDVGKTDHPEYFVENQGGGENKHDDINPSLSVSILKNHVSVGADKGREAGLPVEIIKIIANHHGNDLIQYFYHEALKEQKGESEEIHSEDYSYNNAEIPDSKECAIVMLADGVEAATRSIQGPTPAKFTKMIHSIVLGKIERNQLTNSNLTMNDIAVIENSFLKTLVAQYHSRIEYPDEDDE